MSSALASPLAESHEERIERRIHTKLTTGIRSRTESHEERIERAPRKTLALCPNRMNLMKRELKVPVSVNL